MSSKNNRKILVATRLLSKNQKTLKQVLYTHCTVEWPDYKPGLLYGVISSKFCSNIHYDNGLRTCTVTINGRIYEKVRYHLFG